MTLWVEIALLAALYLALWVWLTWKLQTWFEREIWAARGPREEVVPAERARRSLGPGHEGTTSLGSMTHEQAWKRLPDLLDEPDQPILLHHVKRCHACQRELLLLGRVDRLLKGRRRRTELEAGTSSASGRANVQSAQPAANRARDRRG